MNCNNSFILFKILFVSMFLTIKNINLRQDV